MQILEFNLVVYVIRINTSKNLNRTVNRTCKSLRRRLTNNSEYVHQIVCVICDQETSIISTEIIALAWL